MSEFMVISVLLPSAFIFSFYPQKCYRSDIKIMAFKVCTL